MVKDFLSQKSIEYEERDVSRNRTWAQELVNSTGQMGVPVTNFNGEIIVGFDRPRLEQLATNVQTNRRPTFGASIADAGKITARQGSRTVSGAYIGKVKPGSVAQKSGLSPGDIITWLNKSPIAGADDFERVFSSLSPGSRLSIVFLRNNESRTVEAML